MIDPTDYWVFYKPYEGDLPSDEDLKYIKAIFVTGSTCHSVL